VGKIGLALLPVEIRGGSAVAQPDRDLRMAKRPKKKSLRRRIAGIFVGCLLAVLLLPVGLTAAYRYVPPPITPLMVIRLFEGEGINKDWVPLDRMSPHLGRAVIALEDTAFCSHSGFDWDEVANAVEDRLKGEPMRGASTISMQTAKNVFLWPDRHVTRKLLEAPLTVLIETFWDKRRILEVYLNVIEWGPGIYGIEAASHTYFGKPASRISRREAALLAAVLPNPRRWSPAPLPGNRDGVRIHSRLAPGSEAGNRLRVVRVRRVPSEPEDSSFCEMSGACPLPVSIEREIWPFVNCDSG
jgi:monofunctional biosynthetic peptidoglycan transglycosylase